MKVKVLVLFILFGIHFDLQWGYDNTEGYDDAEAQIVYSHTF